MMSARGKCVGWRSYRPRGLGEFISYYFFDLKYKTIWEEGGKRTSRLASYGDLIKDVHEYP